MLVDYQEALRNKSREFVQSVVYMWSPAPNDELMCDLCEAPMYKSRTSPRCDQCLELLKGIS